jgi:hypothetical protein
VLVEDAVAGWADRVPELRPVSATLVELLRHGTGRAAGSAATAFALMAAPWGEALLSGYLTVWLWRYGRGNGVDLDAILAACRADLAGMEAPGLAGSARVVLNSGVPAIRVRTLAIPDQDGSVVTDAVAYYVPRPGDEVFAEIEFTTSRLDLGDELVAAADAVVGTFEWTWRPE